MVFAEITEMPKPDKEMCAAGGTLPTELPSSLKRIGPTPNRVCVLILGMHRSGTSALARVISLFGAELPAHVMGPGLGNETGHWEPERLVALHDEMLANLGSSWDDWRALDLADPAIMPGGRYWSEVSSIIKEEYGDALLIVLKEPRICRFAPFYAKLLRANGYEVKFVHAFRNPLAVAASLQQRNDFPSWFSHLIWLRHALDAEAATRGACRVFSSYEELIEEPRRTAERIAASLAIDAGNNASVEADIACFVDEAHRHHQSDLAALVTDPGVSSWLKDAYQSLMALQRNPDDPSALTKLDGIREAFNTAAIHVGAPLLAEKERRVGDLAAALADRDERIAELGAALADRDKRIAALDPAPADGDEHVAQLKAALTSRDRDRTASKETIASRDALIARLEATLAERNLFATDLAHQLASVRANPFRAQYDLFVYRIFTVLLCFRFWMTPRFAEKCTNSANKRNPLRSIAG